MTQPPLKEQSDNMLENKPYFLEVMERISALSLQADSFDEMLTNILDAILDIFDCDRAFFQYPVDPDADTWNVPMERTRPEWPGAYETGLDYPSGPDERAYYQLLLTLNGPFCAGGENEIELPEISTKVFKMQTAMAIVLYPKIGKPWQFGIQHCAKSVRYTDEDRNLFEAISHRVADALTSMIMQKNLQESEAFQQAIYDSAPDAIIIFDADQHKIKELNQTACHMLGYEKELLAGRSCDLISMGKKGDHASSQYLVMMLDRAATGDLVQPFEFAFYDNLGNEVVCEVRLTLLPSTTEGKRVYAHLIDISDKYQADAMRRLLSSAVEQTADAVVVTDDKGVIEFVNHAFVNSTGYSRDELVGNTHNITKSDMHDQAFYEAMWKTISSGETFSGVVVNRRRDGTLFSEEKTITPILDADNRPTHYVATGKDISERLRNQEKLYFLAHHDALTRLPNRLLFIERLNQAMTQSKRNQTMVAVFYIDLDHFKHVNDTVGHDVGDKVLQDAAMRLRDCVRGADTVARLSGDEFAIVLEDLGSSEIAAKVAGKVVNRFASSFKVDLNQFYITPSIGVSIFPHDGSEAMVLLKNADIAMYQAKKQGRNGFQFYANEMSVQAEQRHYLENNLHGALVREEFYLLYQPQLDTRSNTVMGVEALLRWENPSMGMVLPMEFIPVLEDTGMIEAVGDWVLETACKQIRSWIDQGKQATRVAVNISARQFERGRLVDSIKEKIARYAIPAELLELELTESILVRNEERAGEILLELRSVGVHLSLDDFGTGYSSLIYLKRFPIDTIKIDRSFVMEVGIDKDSEMIIEGVIAMAKSLNLEVVAEGVETDEQERFLRERGCDYLQGYGISRPIDVEKLAVMIPSGSGLSR